MMAGSVGSVKELRDRTGAGMMDCKAALEASGGDIEKAIDVLRKKGAAQAATRAGREAREGVVAARIEGGKGALVEVNCETDFVARTDDFKNLASLALEETLMRGESALRSEKLNQRLAELSGKIGEKLLVRRAALVESADGLLFSYVHSNHKLGVLVEVRVSRPESKKEAALEELGKNLAMQVAAAHPISVARAQIPPAILEREKAIFEEEAKGKPRNIFEKIVYGKLEKFYQTGCLLEQPFIRDDKVSVQRLVQEAGKKLGDIQIRRFIRFQLGENPAS